MEHCDITVLNKFQAIPQIDSSISYNEHLLRCENEAMVEFIRRNGMWDTYKTFLNNALNASTHYQNSYVFECIDIARDCAKERELGKFPRKYDKSGDY